MRHANILTILVAFLEIVHETSAVVTMRTFCTLTGNCENGKACGVNLDTGFLPLTEKTVSVHEFPKSKDDQPYAECVIPAMPKDISTTEPQMYEYNDYYAYYRNQAARIEETTQPNVVTTTLQTTVPTETTLPTTTTVPTRQTTTPTLLSTNVVMKNDTTTTVVITSERPKKVDTPNQIVWCQGESSNCPEGTKCGMNYVTGFVPFNDDTAKLYSFIAYGPGKKVAVCVVPAEKKNSIFEDVLIEVGQVDLNRAETRTLFEKTFLEESEASSAHFSYSSAQRRLRRLSTSTLVDITLEYESKADAVRNLDKIKTESFRQELVSALQNQDPEAFENVVVSPVKVTRLIQADTTDSTEPPAAPVSNAGQKASADEGGMSILLAPNLCMSPSAHLKLTFLLEVYFYSSAHIWSTFRIQNLQVLQVGTHL